jgi:hypothetical protein
MATTRLAGVPAANANATAGQDGEHEGPTNGNRLEPQHNAETGSAVSAAD